MLARAGWRRVWGAASRRGDGPGRCLGRPPVTDVDYVLAVPERAGLIFGVLLAWAGPLSFWVPSLRDAYIYHYMPSYTFALVLLAGFVDRLYTRRQLAPVRGRGAGR